MKQLLITLGWLFVLCLIALMVYAVIPTNAKADTVPAYELVVATYDSAHGHFGNIRGSSKGAPLKDGNDQEESIDDEQESSECRNGVCYESMPEGYVFFLMGLWLFIVVAGLLFGWWRGWLNCSASDSDSKHESKR